MPRDKIARSGSVNRRYTCYCGREFAGDVNRVNPMIARHARACEHLSDEQRRVVLTDAGVSPSFSQLRAGTQSRGFRGFSDFVRRDQLPDVPGGEPAERHEPVEAAADGAASSTPSVDPNWEANLAALLAECELEEAQKKTAKSKGRKGKSG